MTREGLSSLGTTYEKHERDSMEISTHKSRRNGRNSRKTIHKPMMCIAEIRAKSDQILLSRSDYPALAGADNPPPAEKFWNGPDLPWQNRSGTRVAILLILASKENTKDLLQ